MQTQAETRFIVAVVPYGSTMTDKEQQDKLKSLGVHTSRQTVGVWGDDANEIERGLWTTDQTTAWALARLLNQKAIWECEYRKSGRIVGVVRHLDDSSSDYLTEGQAYNALGLGSIDTHETPTTNYTYFLGDKVTIG